MLTDVESKSLICLYSHANPFTGIVQLRIKQIADHLRLTPQPIANAVDAMTERGILEVVEPPKKVDGVWQAAVRRLVLTPALAPIR